jgi:hypothetical protein
MSLELFLQQMSDPSTLSWKDETYDLSLARDITGAERTTLIAQLSEQARQGDTRAILTLGHLDAQESLPMLRAAATGNDPWAGTARRALVLLGKGNEVIDQIADDAVASPAKMARVAAIMDLGKLGGPKSLAALQKALVEEDSEVRLIAWDALIETLGLTKRLQSPEGIRELTTEVEVMRVLLGSEIHAMAKLGAAGMNEILRRLASGASPQQLGIAWRPKPVPELFDKLRLTLYDTDGEFPVDDIAKLTGIARQLAETMIVMRLEDWDERVPDALVKLDAAWTAPALEELAASPDAPDELRGKLATAARKLATS